MAIYNVLGQVKQFVDYDTNVQTYAYKQYFSDELDEISLLYGEYKEEILVMTGYELADRFIDRLDYAGFSPYMFNEGRAVREDKFKLTRKQCLALGMNEHEFKARKQNG